MLAGLKIGKFLYYTSCTLQMPVNRFTYTLPTLTKVSAYKCVLPCNIGSPGCNPGKKRAESKEWTKMMTNRPVQRGRVHHGCCHQNMQMETIRQRFPTISRHVDMMVWSISSKKAFMKLGRQPKTRQKHKGWKIHHSAMAAHQPANIGRQKTGFDSL